MFQPTVQDLSTIVSMSSSPVGDLLKRYLEAIKEGAKTNLCVTDPYSVKEIAGQQVVIAMCNEALGFLSKDLETLLMEYGLEQEEEDEE